MHWFSFGFGPPPQRRQHVIIRAKQRTQDTAGWQLRVWRSLVQRQRGRRNIDNRMMPHSESGAKSPILDVTETVSLHSDMDIELEASYAPKAGLPAPHTLRLPLPFHNLSMLNASKTAAAALPAFEYIAPPHHALQSLEFPLMEFNRVGMLPSFMQRRTRGEKRPIPDAQKDDKYYERRKRNNEAAKKSRDARKIREDRIAFRAALLEQENSILRAQVMALRDELQTVRQLLGATTGGMLGMARQM